MSTDALRKVLSTSDGAMLATENELSGRKTAPRWEPEEEETVDANGKTYTLDQLHQLLRRLALRKKKEQSMGNPQRAKDHDPLHSDLAIQRMANRLFVRMGWEKRYKQTVMDEEEEAEYPAVRDEQSRQDEPARRRRSSTVELQGDVPTSTTDLSAKLDLLLASVSAVRDAQATLTRRLDAVHVEQRKV